MRCCVRGRIEPRIEVSARALACHGRRAEKGRLPAASYLRQGLSAWLLLLALYAQPAYAENGYFAVRSAETRLPEEVYLLDAYFDYVFNDTLKDALRNGVPLTVVVDIEVMRERPYWLDAHVASIRQRYKLSYHDLTQQYAVHHLNTGIQESFSNLYSALDAIRNLTDLPLLDKQLIEPRQTHTVHIQTYLDIEALPAPLRPVAYFSSAWRLSSDNYTCPLSE